MDIKLLVFLGLYTLTGVVSCVTFSFLFFKKPIPIERKVLALLPLFLLGMFGFPTIMVWALINNVVDLQNY